jgi:hypothetical protein
MLEELLVVQTRVLGKEDSATLQTAKTLAGLGDGRIYRPMYTLFGVFLLFFPALFAVSAVNDALEVSPDCFLPRFFATPPARMLL